MNPETRALFAEGGAWAIVVRFILWPLVKAYVPKGAQPGVIAASCILCGLGVSLAIPAVSFAAGVGAAFSGVGTAMLAHTTEKRIGKEKKDAL